MCNQIRDICHEMQNNRSIILLDQQRDKKCTTSVATIKSVHTRPSMRQYKFYYLFPHNSTDSYRVFTQTGPYIRISYMDWVAGAIRLLSDSKLHIAAIWCDLCDGCLTKPLGL